MIPADIKEMAKHDPLVAEIVAMKGPFFYAEYQQLRNGRAAEVIKSRLKKATMGLIAFVVFWGYHLVKFLVMSNSDVYYRDWLSTGLDIMMVLLWCVPIPVMEYNRRKLKRLQERIDAGEFSAD